MPRLKIRPQPISGNDAHNRIGQYEGAEGETAQYAFPFKQEVKSLVWYSPDNFAEMGYEVPETFEDLMALQEQIVADGGTPWCIGLESGGATGWAARAARSTS